MCFHLRRRFSLFSLLTNDSFPPNHMLCGCKTTLQIALIVCVTFGVVCAFMCPNNTVDITNACAFMTWCDVLDLCESHNCRGNCPISFEVLCTRTKTRCNLSYAVSMRSGNVCTHWAEPFHLRRVSSEHLLSRCRYAKTERSKCRLCLSADHCALCECQTHTCRWWEGKNMRIEEKWVGEQCSASNYPFGLATLSWGTRTTWRSYNEVIIYTNKLRF